MIQQRGPVMIDVVSDYPCYGEIPMFNRTPHTRVPAGLVLAGLSIGVMAGCVQNQPFESMVDQVVSADRPLAEPVAMFDQSYGGDAGLTEGKVYLVSTEIELEALGTETIAANHDVDFRTQDLVILALGEQPNTGYWTQITAIQLEGTNLQVQATANQPGPDDIVVQELTYPYCAAKILKTGAHTVQSDVTSVHGQAKPN